MALRKKSRKKVWSCDRGCNIEKTGVPCKHLEALINDESKEPQFESVNRRYDVPIDSLYYSSGAGFVIPEGIKSGKYEAQFRKKLQGYGLSELQTEILVHSFIYSETLKDIANELGVNSASTVLRFKSEALQMLKRKGFGKR